MTHDIDKLRIMNMYEFPEYCKDCTLEYNCGTIKNMENEQEIEHWDNVLCPVGWLVKDNKELPHTELPRIYSYIRHDIVKSES